MRVPAARFGLQIAAAVDAVRIRSSGSFTFAGVPSAVGSRETNAVMPPRALRRQLRDAIADRLYTGFYVTGGVRPGSVTGATPRSGRSAELGGPPWPDGELIGRLSEANAGTGPWTGGWRMRGTDRVGDPIVSRHGLSLLAPASACRPAGDGGSRGSREMAARGREVEVRYPKELLGASPGFYTAMGDTPIPEEDPVLRVYWNLRPSGAEAFVALATRAFNRRRVPFELKVPHHRAGFARRDAGIVYLPPIWYRPVLPSLRSMHAELLEHLRGGVPALTCPVARGVSVAEDPRGGDSFGSARCGLLAEGIVRAHERRIRPRDERLAVALDAFWEAGVDPDRPYLNPGSAFEPLPLAVGIGRAGPRRRPIATRGRTVKA
jgi:hypothetical protein